MNIQEFKTVVEDDGKLKTLDVKGSMIKLNADIKNVFFIYNDTKTYHVVESATGISIAQSDTSFLDAIVSANETIKESKKEGVYYKKMLLNANQLAKHNIQTPINNIRGK